MLLQQLASPYPKSPQVQPVFWPAIFIYLCATHVVFFYMWLQNQSVALRVITVSFAAPTSPKTPPLTSGLEEIPGGEGRFETD